jgi:hypothetical protein
MLARSTTWPMALVAAMLVGEIRGGSSLVSIEPMHNIWLLTGKSYIDFMGLNAYLWGEGVHRGGSLAGKILSPYIGKYFRKLKIKKR